MANDEIVTEIVDTYSRMSLKQLLTEENLMTALFHKRALDSGRKIVLSILRSEIEGRLQ